MNLVICTQVFRDEGKPLFQVALYDIDAPVNFHSYECYCFKKGRDLKSLLEEVEKVRDEELHKIDCTPQVVDAKE